MAHSHASSHRLRNPASVAVIISALLVACSSNSSGASASGGVGAPCQGNSACETGLYCYQGQAPLAGMCTMNCSVGTGADDPCALKYPNTACLVAGVCGLQCGNGLACPTGTTCDSSSNICDITAGSSSGAGSSGSGTSASMVATGTPTSGSPVSVTFSGAAANEAASGVFCEYISSNDYLVINGMQGNDNVNLRLSDFIGASRTESFSSTSSTASVGVMLIVGSSAFDYDLSNNATGGSCATTITEFDTALQGTFDCPILPTDAGTGQTGQSLTISFQCPVTRL